MRDLVPLRVKIGLKPNGQALYPTFNSLPSVQTSGMDWSKYIDVEGEGWIYDKKSGHDDDDDDSPRGQQWAVLLIPKPFADEAVAAFPNDCKKVTEAQLQAFYDDRALFKAQDVERDEIVLTELLADWNLVKEMLVEFPGNAKLEESKQSLKVQLKKALDPDDEHPGVKKNWRRRWADYKIRKKINIVS